MIKTTQNDETYNILIIGMSGGLAKILANLLLRECKNCIITGVDTREVVGIPKDPRIILKKMSYTRGNFENLFRNHSFHTVYHLGRIGHSAANPNANLAQRLNISKMGTNRILELSLKFGVKKLVILSTFHVYGAYSDNPIFIKEDAPLRASSVYPDLRDVVEMDQIAVEWMWKHQGEIDTIVLRPATIVGPQIQNSFTRYLKAALAPVPMDFNPMMQFVHEFDMARVFLECMNRIPSGVYNVAHRDVISLRESKRIVNGKIVYGPLFLFGPIIKMCPQILFKIPEYLIDFVKYSCIMDCTQLQSVLDEDFFRFSPRESLELIKLS